MRCVVTEYRYEGSCCSLPLETKLRIIVLIGAGDGRNAAVHGRDDCESRWIEWRALHD